MPNSSPAAFVGEESASAGKTADSSHDTAALRNDNIKYVLKAYYRPRLTGNTCNRETQQFRIQQVLNRNLSNPGVALDSCNCG